MADNDLDTAFQTAKEEYEKAYPSEKSAKEPIVGLRNCDRFWSLDKAYEAYLEANDLDHLNADNVCDEESGVKVYRHWRGFSEWLMSSPKISDPCWKDAVRMFHHIRLCIDALRIATYCIEDGYDLYLHNFLCDFYEKVLSESSIYQAEGDLPEDECIELEEQLEGAQ